MTDSTVKELADNFVTAGESRLVSREAIGAFADLSDDHSPVHIDPAFAREHGLPNNYAHGLLGAVWATGAATRQFAGQLAVTGEINYATPVFCEDKLSLELCLEQSSVRQSRVEQSSAKSSGCSASCHYRQSNQHKQQTSHGVLAFSDVAAFVSDDRKPSEEPLDASRRAIDTTRVHGARDMLEHGPVGACGSYRISAAEQAAYQAFTGEVGSDEGLSDDSASDVISPLLIFCKSFSRWLEDFTSVPTPDAGFPGHLVDRWQQWAPVRADEELVVVHRPVELRESRSRPNMSLLTIAIQTQSVSGQLLQSGSVLLMMPTEAG